MKNILIVLILGLSFGCGVKQEFPNITPNTDFPVDGVWEWTSSKTCSRLNPAPTTPETCNCTRVLVLNRGKASFYEGENKIWESEYTIKNTEAEMGSYYPFHIKATDLEGWVHLESEQLIITKCPVDGVEHSYQKFVKNNQ